MASVSFSRLPNCEHAAGRQHHLCNPHGHITVSNPTFLFLVFGNRLKFFPQGRGGGSVPEGLCSGLEEQEEQEQGGCSLKPIRNSTFPKINMSNLFSFQGQKFGQKRRGGGHHGHGGKRGRR